MPANDRDIAGRAFATAEWRTAADALFQATGVTVNAMDFGAARPLCPGTRCAGCHLAADVAEPGPSDCFDEGFDPQSGRAVCRAGLAALIGPVERAGGVLGHIVIGGFVTSTRERRGLYERLLVRGVGEDAARRAIKGLPVISRRQAESYLQVALSTAATVVDATAERIAAADRVSELKLFVSTGAQVAAAENLDAGSLGEIAEEAVALIGGEAGAVLRPHGGGLEVVARTKGWRGPLGAIVPRESTASGRAFETRRAVVAPNGNKATSTLAMPLSVAQHAVGVLEVRLDSSALPVPKEQLVRLSRFTQFVAIALEREDERARADRAMSGYTQLSQLAATLGGQTDTGEVAGVVNAALDRSFPFDVAGIVLAGWGKDRADVVVDGPVTPVDLDHVLGVVSGRDLSRDPFGEVRVTGETTPGDEGAEDWAIASCEFSYGDLTVGWLFVARCDGTRYCAQDRALLEGIAMHAGAAFGRAALFTRIRDDYASTIAALSSSLDRVSPSVNSRSGKVMDFALAIGEELGLASDELEQLRFAGLLHDVGSAGLVEEIVLRPRQLTPDEIVAGEQRLEMGSSVLEQIDFLKSLTPIVLHHHEQWDGTGWPQGLAGAAIPLPARVLAVADEYDALTTGRGRSRRLSPVQARGAIAQDSGTRFDPQAVVALFAVLERMALAGSTGLLAGESARGRAELPA